jgi:hypothetical protein
MLKRILIAALMLPLVAFAQSYPSPTFNNVTVQGTLTAATPAFTSPVPVTSGGTGATTAATARTNLGAASTGANTFTGNQTVSIANANLTLSDSGGTGQARVNLWNNGVQTWGVVLNSSTNAFSINRYVSGTLVDNPISISNGTGTTAFTVRPTFNGATPWDSANLNFATPPAIGGTTPASGAFTTLSATEPSNGLNTLQVTNTGSQGANIHMTGNGSTTPTKYLRVVNGSFGIANDANSALALALTDAGNLSVLGSIQPSQTGGIIGTNTTNNANAGSVGEYVTASATSVALTSGTATNVTSISLTAGDWDVWGNIQFVPAGSTIMSQWISSISSTSATQAVPPFLSVQTFTTSAGLTQSLVAPMQRISVSSTTTIFLVGTATFSASTCAANGYISARRRR